MNYYVTVWSLVFTIQLTTPISYSFLQVNNVRTTTELEIKWILNSPICDSSKPCYSQQFNEEYKCVIHSRYPDGSLKEKNVPDSYCENVTKPGLIATKVSPTDNNGQNNMWKTVLNWGICLESNCLKDGKIVSQECLDNCSNYFQHPVFTIGRKGCKIQDCFDPVNNIWLADSECSKTSVRPINLCEVCRLSFPLVNCPPVRFVTPWSECSKTCGRGFQSRILVCSLLTTAGESDVFPQNTLNQDECYRPDDVVVETRQVCGVVDCPPRFEVGPWGPCLNAYPYTCGKGVKRRNVTCITYLGNGKSQVMRGLKSCIVTHGKENIPPPWQTCMDYEIKLSNKCKEKFSNKTAVIVSSKGAVYQIRRVNRVKITIGEDATVYMNTNLVIKCPVIDWDVRDILWFHDNLKVSNIKHHSMDFKGRMKIFKLVPSDTGTWTCKVGARNQQSNVSSVVNVIFPDDGHRYVSVREMMGVAEITEGATWVNDAGKKQVRKQQIISEGKVQWIPQPWGACSQHCGKAGNMTRRVICEQLYHAYVKVVDDKKCETQGLKKPVEISQCQGLSECPTWIPYPDAEKCTSECVKPGKALLVASFYCGIGAIKFADNDCLSKNPAKDLSLTDGTKTCPAPKCQLMWKVSEWSPCSSLCGQSGITARQITCVWKESQLPADALCYEHMIQVPQTTKPCKPPSCNRLICIDRSDACSTYNVQNCEFNFVQKHCCKTCHTYFVNRKIKTQSIT